MDSKELVTGIIVQGEDKIAFTKEGFRFVFVVVKGTYDAVELKSDDAGYVWGITRDKIPIAIYIKNSRVISHTLIIESWNYIVFREPINEKDQMRQGWAYEGIRFVGGGLNSVFPCGILNRDFNVEQKLEKMSENKNSYIVYRLLSNRHEYNISEEFSVNKGTTLSNDASVLDILFEDTSSLKAFYDYYGYVTAILGFLTFRKEVSFDSVFLAKRYEGEIYYDIADCYVRTTDNSEIRDVVKAIPIKSFSKESFSKLVYNVMNDEGKVKIPVSILPSNDAAFWTISIDKVRNICSCLEQELSAAHISVSKEDAIQNLKNEVSDLIKMRRDEDDSLILKKTYDSILSGIGHWGDTLGDKTIKAWELYKDVLKSFCVYYHIFITEDDIKSFVKARNNITHNGFNEIDYKLAETALIMTALVYYMALKRFGIEDDIIKDRFSNGLIG